MGPGGSERQLAELAKALDPAQFAVHVGFFRKGVRSDELSAAGIPCLEIGVRSFLRPHVIAGALTLAKYLRHHKVQIVHAFDYPLACFGVPIAKACGTRVVLSSQRGHRKLIPEPYLRVVRWTDHLVDGIVVNCRAMQQHLLGEERIQSGRIHLCLNGIDARRFSAGARPDTFGQSTFKPLVVGCVAVMRPEKNLSLLVKAFSLVAKRRPSMKLLLAGSGPADESLRSLVGELGLAESCTFTPAEADIAPWLRSIDIFVLPSVSEALSNSLMEAMAAGCAVIASNVGGNPELVTHWQTGLLFKSGDVADLAEKLDLLAEDAAYRAALSRAGAASIRENFSLESAARRMESIYAAMLNR